MNAQLPTPEETRPSSPKRLKNRDTIRKNETRQNIYEGVEAMYKNYCDDDWIGMTRVNPSTMYRIAGLRMMMILHQDQ